MVDPALALQGMTNEDLYNPTVTVGLETYRWFGAITLTFGGYIFFRVLDTPGLKPVLEGLLIGDVLYLGSLTPFTYRYGKLPMIIGPYALTLVMFVARLAYLYLEDWKNINTVSTSTKVHENSSDTTTTTVHSKLLDSSSVIEDDTVPKNRPGTSVRSVSTGREKRRTSK